MCSQGSYRLSCHKVDLTLFFKLAGPKVGGWQPSVTATAIANVPSAWDNFVTAIRNIDHYVMRYIQAENNAAGG